MVNRTVGWKPRPAHILQLSTNSALLEGTVSIVFDLVFLASAELLIAQICASHNLRLVYDAGTVLRLRPRNARSLTLALAPVAAGPSGLSRALSFLLLIVTAAVVVLGFSINGRSQNEFTHYVVRSLASIHAPPAPLSFNYRDEYRFDRNQSEDEKPRWQSGRLVALQMIDKCLVCQYSSCNYLAYVFPSAILGSELLDTQNIRKLPKGVCVTKTTFREDVINWSYSRAQKSPRRKCKMERIEVSSKVDDVPTSGKPVVQSCDFTIVMTRCYRRKDAKTRCAMVGRFEADQRMHVLVARNAEPESGLVDLQIAFFEMARVTKLTTQQMQQYLDGVSFLASLNLAPAYKLDLMAFVHVTYNEILQRRNVLKDMNVSDVDIRLAIPSMIILVTTAVVLGVVALKGWVVEVYSKERQYFNSFTTVPDVLELLLESGAHVNRGRKEKGFSPAVGIRRDTARIGVQAPGEDVVGGSTMDEREVL